MKSNRIPKFNEFIKESEHVDESITVSIVGGTIAAILVALGLSTAQEIKDRGGWKKLWNEYKENTKLQKIVNRIKSDPEIKDMMEIPEEDRDENWRDLITAKLSPAEIKYTKEVFDNFEEF